MTSPGSPLHTGEQSGWKRLPAAAASPARRGKKIALDGVAAGGKHLEMGDPVVPVIPGQALRQKGFFPVNSDKGGQQRALFSAPEFEQSAGVHVQHVDRPDFTGSPELGQGEIRCV